MVNIQSFTGLVIGIDDFITGHNSDSGCYKLLSIRDNDKNIVNFVISPSTFFLNQEVVAVGDIATGFYDINLPTPLIFPPRFQAMVISKPQMNRFVKVDSFNRNLISSDGTLQLLIAPCTEIKLTNGQPFTGDLSTKTLVAVYRFSTRSIPAQTTPDQIIVLC